MSYDCLIKHALLNTHLIKGPVIDLKRISFTDEQSHEGLPFYCFSMLHGDQAIGKITLRLGYNDLTMIQGHVGYEIYPFHQGHHYAYYGLWMIMDLARSHGYQAILLTTERKNEQSMKTVMKAGGRFLKEVIVPKDHIYHVLGIESVSLYEIRL